MKKEQFKEMLKQLRPFIIENIQREAIRKYQFDYTAHNKEVPSKEEVNKFIESMIVEGSIIKKADEIIEEVIEYLDKQERKDILKIISNSAFALSILYTIGLYLAYYFKIIEFEKAFQPMNILNAFCAFVFVFIVYAITVFKKS